MRQLHNRRIADQRLCGFKISHGYSSLSRIACARSASRSSLFSMPMDSRISPSVMPTFCRTSKGMDAWLGRGDFSMAANIYAHLDYSSKISSAQAMEKGMLLPSSEGFESRWIDTEAEDAGEMSSNNEA